MNSIKIILLTTILLVNSCFAKIIENKDLDNAIKNQNYKKIKEIFLQNDINNQYYIKEYNIYINPIIYSILEDKKELFDFLLENEKIDLYKTTPKGLNAIVASLRVLENYYLKEFIKKSIKLKPTNGISPYSYISLNLNFPSKVELLLKSGVNYLYKDKNGKNVVQNFIEKYRKYTNLYKIVKANPPSKIELIPSLNIYYKKLASQKNGKERILKSLEIQKILLKRAIEKLYKTEKTRTTYLKLIKKDKEKAILYYLENNSTINRFKNIQNSNYSPLFIAIKKRLKRYYEPLAKAGITIDDDSHRNIDLVIKQKDYQSIKLFKTLGMDINHIDKYGNSYFFRNVYTYKNLKMLKLIISLGYNLPNLKNRHKIYKEDTPKWHNDIIYAHKFLIQSNEKELFQKIDNIAKKYHINLQYSMDDIQKKDNKFYIKNTTYLFSGIINSHYNYLEKYIEVKNGLKDGNSVVSYENGNPYIYNRYSKGKLIGSIIFYKNFKKKILLIYDNNENIIEKEFYDKDGNKKVFPKDINLEKLTTKLKYI